MREDEVGFVPRGSELVEGVHDVERLEAAQRCSFGCADWRRHCRERAVYETDTLRAREEHRAQFDHIGGPDTTKRGWRRIDGGAVALVLVVLAFLLMPGCGETVERVQTENHRSAIADARNTADWRADGWHWISDGNVYNGRDGWTFVRVDEEGRWATTFVPRDGAK